MVKFLSPVQALLDKGFKDTGRASGFNLGLTFNLAHALTGDYPDYSIDYSKVQLSQGGLLGEFAATAQAEPGKIIFTWPALNKKVLNAFADDSASILVYNVTRDIHMASSGTLRSELSAEMDIPAGFIGDTLHCTSSLLVKMEEVLKPPISVM